MRRAGGRMGTTATSGPSARRPTRAFVRGGRERAVLEQAIGADYPGVLVSDFYAAYTTYDGTPPILLGASAARCGRPGRAAPRRSRRAGLGRWRPRALSARHGRSTMPIRRSSPGSGRRTSGSWARCARPSCGTAGHRSGCCASGSPSIWRELFVFVEDPAVPADQQRRRAQPAPSGDGPQDQRRHPLTGRHGDQDDAGHALRHLAAAGPRSPGRSAVPSSPNPQV